MEKHSLSTILVLDHQGHPVADADIWFSRFGEDHFSKFIHAGVAPETGTYSLSLPRGEYLLTIQAGELRNVRTCGRALGRQPLKSRVRNISCRKALRFILIRMGDTWKVPKRQLCTKVKITLRIPVTNCFFFIFGWTH